MFELKMKYVKSTKNTHRYESGSDAPPLIPTIYINKGALPDTPPQMIKITVEGVGDGT